MADQKADTTHENAIGWLILLAVIGVLMWAAWYFFEYDIKNLVRWIRYYELRFLGLFLDRDHTVYWRGAALNYHDFVDRVPHVPHDCRRIDGGVAGNIGFCLNGETMSLINRISQDLLKWPVMGLLGAMGLIAYMFGPKTVFRRRLGIEGIIHTQSRIFPVILPFVRFNPSNQPPRPPGSLVPVELPLFAEALGPEEWLAYHTIPIPDGKIDHAATRRAFARQLGKPWRGVQALEPYKQVLFAAFCLKAARKRADSDEMLGRLSACWTPEKGISLDRKLLKQARAILADSKLSGTVLANANQHGFETTALLRALATAREEGGVLAPAQFLWLRGYDRILWYPLNNLGRQSYHMEALGAMAHYKAEKLTQRPIPRPKVDSAVTAIADYMASSRARPVPKLDYQGAKKRAIKKPSAA